MFPVKIFPRKPRPRSECEESQPTGTPRDLSEHLGLPQCTVPWRYQLNGWYNTSWMDVKWMIESINHPNFRVTASMTMCCWIKLYVSWMKHDIFVWTHRFLAGSKQKNSLVKPAGSSWAWPRRLWLRTSPSLFVAGILFFKATPKKIDIARMPLT